jgi:hypothetical protein
MVERFQYKPLRCERDQRFRPAQINGCEAPRIERDAWPASFVVARINIGWLAALDDFRNWLIREAA